MLWDTRRRSKSDFRVPAERNRSDRVNAAELGFEMGTIPLKNTAFEGDNNSYVLGLETRATATTLIDTGVATGETENELQAGLARYDLSFSDVDRILLTHHHADHAGLAGKIQAESGCSVFAHEADAPLIGGDPDAVATYFDRIRQMIHEWGVETAKRDELVSFLESSSHVRGDPPTVNAFKNGRTFDLGSVELTAVHMPGHAAGLSGYVFSSPRGEELFCGDALLPYYTPNVGGADVRVEGALELYLQTLAGIIDRGYVRAWPGHRGPIIDPAGRAADVVVHHRERTERILSTLHSGPATPWEIATELFGSLSSIHILHGPGEVYAHLEHLQAAGLVSRDGRVFERVEPNPDLEPLFPDVSSALGVSETG